MTGRELVEKYCNSINALFLENTFNLNVQFSDVQTPCYRTVGKIKSIELPNAIKTLEFDGTNLEIEFLTLIALGHETAHYLNEHNEIDIEELNIAIELWADYFGGKTLFTLFLHDDFFKNRYSFFNSPDQLIENYYQGLCNVYEYYYSNANANGHYPSKELRMQVGLTASTSVFSSFTGNLDNKYSISAVKKFSENSNFIMEKYDKTEIELSELRQKIEQAHALIIKEENFISKNMKKEYLKYITTAYRK